ncbi:MAG: DUF1648 domain-containing protein [Nanoarchaeota archaeon]|nr:DUF1648 domain-containing protein [Nanoarchaeota archaeon]MBU4300324.1 DUF1648 domain-containing protein [Nanoarchaeota archaeon]MBU4452599.1 DUF1648 domain-containing protein [Nanoarchaeota archaeon]MCG2723557.1 DUF1648 domain-containing protein [archaeon]
MRKSEMFAVAVILLSFIVGAYFYPSMPDRMASHWNAKGEVNGYMPKFWGLFFVPFLSAGLLLFFTIIPKIDPRRQNIAKFRQYYDAFIALLMGFMFYLYLLTIAWNLGYRFDMLRLMVPALGALFYYLGILIENAKQNWFVGIRTPWTLSSERVWNKTHKLGGKLFKFSGIVAFIGIFFSKYAIWFIIAPIILVSFYLLCYSYIEYRKEKKK